MSCVREFGVTSKAKVATVGFVVPPGGVFFYLVQSCTNLYKVVHARRAANKPEPVRCISADFHMRNFAPGGRTSAVLPPEKVIHNCPDSVWTFSLAMGSAR